MDHDLIALCQDLSGLFYADTTAHRDRKEIIRTMIERVLVTERTAETVSLSIQWADGSEATPVEVRLMRYAHRLIEKLARQGLKNVQIAGRLNELGLETSRGRAWSRATVWQVRQYERIRASGNQRESGTRGPRGHGNRVISTAADNSTRPRRRGGA